MDRAALLAWYRAEARVLPWRSDPTPYHVLLSEFMCQQTRVETALPYYERFLARWPTLQDLAAEDQEAIVEAWAGLGYYRRARRLHEAARAGAQMGGLPSTAEELARLPGIGPYTAGAIASIAFGRAVPAVDGNVDRVLSRHHRVEEEVDRPVGKRRIRALAEALHDAGEAPGDLNQALMELGARVCTPRRPLCSSCPVAPTCAAREVGDVLDYPRKRPRKKPVPIVGIAGVLTDGAGRSLLVRKAGKGLLGGLWTPPIVLETDSDAALAEAFAQAGYTVDNTVRLGTVRHVFSHRDLTCTVVQVHGRRLTSPGDGWAAVELRSGDDGMSTLARKILQLATPLPLLAADAP